MQHRLDRLFRKRLNGRRLVILIAAVMILSTVVVGALCTPAIRQLFLVNTDTHTEITLADYPAHDWEDAYIPTVFPGEQSRPSVQVTKTQRTLTYHVDQKVLVFYQYRGDTTAGIDTENTAPAKPVQIGNTTGWIADKNGERYLYWMQDGYMFALLGHFSDNEIIATAESVQPKNNQRSE